MEELPYDTLKDFEEEVKEYLGMLKDHNYKKGLKKGEKKMQKMQSEIDRILELDDLISMKEQLKKIRQSI
jgi:predicted type IV restriction endonuclease